MRKIKGFKLDVRPHEFRRRAKKAGLDVAAAAFADPELGKTLERLTKAVAPGVIFDTFGHPDPDQTLLSPLPGLAYSLILATLGEGRVPAGSDPGLEALWPVYVETALDACVRFASALLADEAAKDNCELSPITPLTEKPALETALRKLDGAKLSVSSHDGGGLTPSASVIVSLSWLAKSKAKGRK